MSEWVRVPLIVFGTLPLFFSAMLPVEQSAWEHPGFELCAVA